MEVLVGIEANILEGGKLDISDRYLGGWILSWQVFTLAVMRGQLRDNTMAMINAMKNLM